MVAGDKAMALWNLSFIGNRDPMKGMKCCDTVLGSVLQKAALCQCSGKNGTWWD